MKKKEHCSCSKEHERKEERLYKMAKKDEKTDKKVHNAVENIHREKESKKDSHKKSPKGGKVKKVMEEFKEHKLHSGSKKGPEVKSRKQAVAIALSEARKSGEKVSSKKK